MKKVISSSLRFSGPVWMIKCVLRFVLLYYKQINKSPILCFSDFELQCKHLKKFKSNRATKNHRRKSKGFFCMYGTVALLFPIPTPFNHSLLSLLLAACDLDCRTKIMCLNQLLSFKDAILQPAFLRQVIRRSQHKKRRVALYQMSLVRE